MELGLQIPSFTYPGGPSELGGKLAEIGRAAEDAGYRSIWVMDHYFQIEYVGPTELEMLEAYTTLGYLAAATSRVELGTLVTGVTYRHPGLLGKIVTTLDVLSGGRAWLGIGGAWFEREHRALGVPFPPPAQRLERLEEALQICLQMWSEDNGPFEGKHYRLEETLNSPQALSRPHPPILIGGGGEKKTLRLVARYADACNLFPPPEQIRHKLAVLREHCEREGRDFDSIEKTAMYSIDVGRGGARVDQVIEDLRSLAGAGVQTALGSVRGVADIEPLEIVGREIIPRIK
ncbi:MAG TPA: LLM class F420-dependent oxidoreductase, partial [Actinomycetota bacterium]|nr:LLM class F420-dependent oxidoreductase [Actinomycetota bacterium]